MRSTEEPRHTALASSLRAAPRDHVVLASAYEAIVRGEGRSLFEALLGDISTHVDDSHERLARFMALSESMADQHPAVAVYLMARLHPLADRRRHHDIYRAIELWMHDTTAPDAAHVLKRLAAENVSRALQRRCEEWAKAIELRAG